MQDRATTECSWVSEVSRVHWWSASLVPHRFNGRQHPYHGESLGAAPASGGGQRPSEVAEVVTFRHGPAQGDEETEGGGDVISVDHFDGNGGFASSSNSAEIAQQDLRHPAKGDAVAVDDMDGIRVEGVVGLVTQRHDVASLKVKPGLVPNRHRLEAAAGLRCVVPTVIAT